MKDKLPNFLIVGAAKSGTSSLHNYLNQHPEIFLPSYNKLGMKVKEPRFLVKDLVQQRLHNGVWSWKEYCSLFDVENHYKAIGESTVLYLYYFDHAIKNIKKRLGDKIKIIIMLRNPVDRAYSAFQHVSRGLQENLSFEEALSIESKRLHENKSLTPMVMYKSMGMYYNMVNAYKMAFNDVHIILYDDFRDNPNQTLRKVFEFLSVNPDFRADVSDKYNVGGKRWKNKTLKSLFMKKNILRSSINYLVPGKVKDRIREKIVNISMTKSTPMKKSTRKCLTDFFREDISKLSELINYDLKHWFK